MIVLTVRVIERLYVLLVWVFFGRRSEGRYDDSSGEGGVGRMSSLPAPSCVINGRRLKGERRGSHNDDNLRLFRTTDIRHPDTCTQAPDI